MSEPLHTFHVNLDTRDFKRCGKCKSEKLLPHFSKSVMSRDGLQDWCRDCMREYRKARKAALKYSKVVAA